VVEASHILRAVDDAEMAVLWIEKTRVARTHPAVFGFCFGSLFGVLVVAGENARRAIEHLAAFRELDFDLVIGLAHAFGVNFAVRLRRDVNRSLGLSVKLLQIHAERAVVAENLR